MGGLPTRERPGGAIGAGDEDLEVDCRVVVAGWAWGSGSPGGRLGVPARPPASLGSWGLRNPKVSIG